MCTDGRRCPNCHAQRLAAGSRALSEALPALGTVVTVTANDAALLSHTGEYGAVAHPGEALVYDEDRIALRISPSVVGYRTSRALTLLDDFGTHRAYLTPLTDQLVVEALSAAPVDASEPASPVDWGAVNWDDTDQLDHLDDLSQARYQVLPFQGARRIVLAVVPHLLAYLVSEGLDFTVAVRGGGCVQLHRGRALMADAANQHFAVIFGAARYAVDPVQLSECWVTRAHGISGPTSAIELYDHSRHCVTVLTQTGAVCERVQKTWEALVASLPTCAD
ncbi:hypothetical protein EB75_00165 [Mycobacterium sp. ST-F2]|uniref:hypothetical protein n=1 Tax=Mycobacterium sp. ST-F2 TaxID=1490484 RepID=UPI0009404478|nr:hypothetical protein [Mycobacterium sp. ST-F2]OKH86151.1 hypothetical protein EB75_00165 [Mycobacterium sp. ST-F2]